MLMENIEYDDIGSIQSCFTYRYTVFVMYRFIYENKNIFLFAYSYCTIQFDLKYLLAVIRIKGCVCYDFAVVNLYFIAQQTGQQ